ncbi:hypothetical protein [Ruminococcus sp.]|uniref:hypothetical protein n=1 Tax=Ruminococcus sp. TaxID=41978 RepID=UPI0025DD57CF|nr:hypothetical protein [Ruminococcus sp.]
MEILFNDKTGKWQETPEVYGTINCPTKKDYEYALNAIKTHKQLEAKHWDECRQIAHYDDELKEAKRLLRLAIEDMDNARHGINCGICGMQSCDVNNVKPECKFRWQYADEAEKLIGE